MLTTIRLGGILGKRYGRVWRLDVESPREAIHAINVLKPGFRRTLIELEDVVIGYRVRIGDRLVNRDTAVEELSMQHGSKTIAITPLFKGAGGGKLMSVLQIVAGIVLIAIDIAYVHSGQLSLLGASLILGGVAGLLAPSQHLQGGQPAKHKASYQFGGPVNTIEQGQPFPVCYGDMICGTAVLSAGITNEDILKGSTKAGSRPSNQSGGPSNTGSGQAGVPFAGDYGLQP